MITTAAPPIHRPSSLKKATPQGTDEGRGSSAVVAIKSAHPLFPPTQAFLWLPGLAGDQVAHCTHNVASPPPEHRRITRKPDRDKNQALYAPPHQVSTQTYIAWHTNVTPPFPFHPVPIARTLGAAELVELGRRVHFLANKNEDESCSPLQTLRNDRKCYVLAALAEIGLLAGRVPPPC